MSIEDGMRKATKKIDEAAEAAPTSELVDENDFGTKKEDTDESKADDGAEKTADSPDESDSADVRTDSERDSDPEGSDHEA